MKNVKRTIQWAVGVALASCTPAQPAPPPELAATTGPSVAPPVGSSASAGDAGAADASVAAPAPATADADAPPPVAVVDAGPPIDAKAVCAAYRAKATANPKGPTHQTPTQERSVPLTALHQAGDVDARVQSGRVACRITWERSPIQRTAMVAPRCCPPITQPCPGPSPVPVRAERAKYETAILAPDGTLQSSTVEWLVWVETPPEPPYCGRRTAGVGACAGDRGAPAGHALAEMAELEAVSIRAFTRLARELASFDAPRSLVARVQRARRDELRHARAASRLARRLGARPRPIARGALALRSRAEVARENAVEGCVRETFGAAVATWHAATTPEPALARFFAGIARDERAHAALAWDVARWLERSLDAEERAAVERARSEAIAELRARPAVGGPLGVPAAAARALTAALFGD